VRPAVERIRPVFELTDRDIDNLLHFRESVAINLENPTAEDRRWWLEMLQATVTVKNRMAVVACRLPTQPLEYRLTDVNKS
jgi:hypothetical protein